MKELWANVRLQRADHLHRVAWRSGEAVHGLRKRTVINEVGVRSISRAGDALKFDDKMAGAAVDGLPCEGAWQRSVDGLGLRDDGIADCKRRVHISHAGRKIFSPASVNEDALADILLGGRAAFIFALKLGRLPGAATSQEQKGDRTHDQRRSRGKEFPLRSKQSSEALHRDSPCEVSALEPRDLMYVMTCQREGSGSALQVGMPRARFPFFKSQKISPSVACWTRLLRRLGFFPRPRASGPWHFAQ